MTCRLWEASAADLRQWASECAEQAKAALTDDERHRLATLVRALLDLADNEDWLAGRQSDPLPSATVSGV